MKRLSATVNLKNDDLRKAIYHSCLDVSFAKTGGIIPIIKSGNGYDKAIKLDKDYSKNDKYRI